MTVYNSSSHLSPQELYYINDCVPDFYVECLIALWIWRTIPFVLVIIGTCGNTINIIILSRLRKYSTSVFLIMLAIAEWLYQWVVTVPVAYSALTSTTVDDFGEVICRLRKWLGHTTAGFSVWILVLLNIERILLIKAPMFSRTKLTPRNTLITAGITLSVIATLNAHLLFGRTIQEFSDNSTSPSKVCDFTSDEYRHFSEQTWSVLIFVLYMFLPACIIFIGNINLAAALIIRRKRLTTVRPLNAQKLSNDKQRKSSTMLLFILSTFFLVTTMPYCVYLILKGKVYTFEGRSLARWQLACVVVTLLLTSNFSFNFFFYFVTGTLFKQEWKMLVNKTKERFRNIAGTT